MIGTPEYMSPEQAELTGLDIDTRTDIYAGRSGGVASQIKAATDVDRHAVRWNR